VPPWPGHPSPAPPSLQFPLLCFRGPPMETGAHENRFPGLKGLTGDSQVLDESSHHIGRRCRPSRPHHLARTRLDVDRHVGDARSVVRSGKPAKGLHNLA